MRFGRSVLEFGHRRFSLSTPVSRSRTVSRITVSYSRSMIDSSGTADGNGSTESPAIQFGPSGVRVRNRLLFRRTYVCHMLLTNRRCLFGVWILPIKLQQFLSGPQYPTVGSWSVCFLITINFLLQLYPVFHEFFQAANLPRPDFCFCLLHFHQIIWDAHTYTATDTDETM